MGHSRNVFYGSSPHTRGTLDPPLGLGGFVGSSPHTRGTLPQGIVLRLVGRFIPAHAGNTRAERPERPPCRFIPAHAGNTWTGRCFRKRSTVHPRTRGEHMRWVVSPRSRIGSSPHTRGTRLNSFPRHVRIRFIPAHAGNTIRHEGGRPRFIPAHAGNTRPRLVDSHSWSGSSPHTRGTLLLQELDYNSVSNCQRTYRRFSTNFRGQLCPLRASVLLTKSWIVGGDRQETDELQAVHVLWNAAINATGLKIKTCFVRGGPSHDGVALLDMIPDLIPDHCPRSFRVLSNIYAGPDFQ